MSRGTIILGIVMLGLLGGTVWASSAGWWLPQPTKQPVSIREDSTRPLRAGHHRTRYFVGGGIYRGK